jgi:hypothetical protein
MMRVIILAGALMLSGCQTLVGAGWHQAHIDSDSEESDIMGFVQIQQPIKHGIHLYARHESQIFYNEHDGYGLNTLGAFIKFGD